MNRMLTGVATLTVVAACGPHDVDLGGHGRAEATGGGPIYTGGVGGLGVGGSLATGGVGGSGGFAGVGVGGSFATGGVGGSGGTSGNDCWTESIASTTCADNSVMLGRGYERCDLQGGVLTSITYDQLCDSYTSTLASVVCCAQAAGAGGAGGLPGTGGTSTGGSGG